MATWDDEAKATVLDLARLLQRRTVVSAKQIMDAVNTMQAWRQAEPRRWPPLPSETILKIMEPCIQLSTWTGQPLADAFIAVADVIGRGHGAVEG
jgi:hypothetical protein